MFFRHKKKLTVYTYGADILQKKAHEVKEVTQEIRDLAQEMLVAMELFDGIGLAGPQYGLDKRMVALAVPGAGQGAMSPGEAVLLPRMPMVVINPEVVNSSAETEIVEEACLSLPGAAGNVERPKFIQFRAQTLDGELIECECGGLLARCLQHEIDHLDGLLYIDRMTDEDRADIEYKIKKIKKNGRKKDFQKSMWI